MNAEERYRIARCIDCTRPFRQLFWENRRCCTVCRILRATAKGGRPS